jgi:predicted HTH transcriptional regulator
MSRYFAGLTFDQTPLPDGTARGLDIPQIKKAFASVGRTVDKRKLETLDVLVRHAGKQVVSKGGLILFGRNEVRKSYFPDARVGCARFQGTDRTNFVDRLWISKRVFLTP